MARGVDANIPNKVSWVCLVHAPDTWFTILFKSYEMKILVQNNILHTISTDCVCVYLQDGNTALAVAIQQNQLDVAVQLFESGANPKTTQRVWVNSFE